MPAPSPSAPGNWFNRFQGGHERVKHAVHSYWRQSTILSPRGKFGKVVMSCFYFSLPVMAGYFVVNKVIEGAESTADERLGDRRTIGAASNESSSFSSNSETIGAGGWGGGVHLASSDKQTQDVNRINMERFLKKQRKLMKKRERAAADAAAQH